MPNDRLAPTPGKSWIRNCFYYDYLEHIDGEIWLQIIPFTKDDVVESIHFEKFGKYISLKS